ASQSSTNCIGDLPDDRLPRAGSRLSIRMSDFYEQNRAGKPTRGDELRGNEPLQVLPIRQTSQLIAELLRVVTTKFNSLPDCFRDLPRDDFHKPPMVFGEGIPMSRIDRQDAH